MSVGIFNDYQNAITSSQLWSKPLLYNTGKHSKINVKIIEQTSVIKLMRMVAEQVSYKMSNRVIVDLIILVSVIKYVKTQVFRDYTSEMRILWSIYNKIVENNVYSKQNMDIFDMFLNSAVVDDVNTLNKSVTMWIKNEYKNL